MAMNILTQSQNVNKFVFKYFQWYFAHNFDVCFAYEEIDE